MRRGARRAHRVACFGPSSIERPKPTAWRFPAARIRKSVLPDSRLGGGNGWLMGMYGATCDNLLAANVITADGQSVSASATDNPDLFWALRGGGGNFGIVTSFCYRLHPVGPMVMGGAVLYAYKDALKVLRNFHDFARSAPDSLTVYACLIYDDGQPVVAIAACYAGSHDRAEATVTPLRKWGTI